MTEKRFTIIETQIGRIIRDNETDVNTGDIGIIFDWLNELHEENQQYENEIARLQLINDKLKDKDYTNYKKKIQELQEENTRLRQCLNEIYLISSRESVE